LSFPVFLTFSVAFLTPLRTSPFGTLHQAHFIRHCMQKILMQKILRQTNLWQAV